MPIIYYLVVTVIFVGLYFWKKKWDLSLLIAYMFLVLAYTVLKRKPGGDHGNGMVLFWSYKAIFEARGYSSVYRTTLLIQIIANIMMFVPIGFLAGRIIKWKSIALGFMFSALIEITQLVTNRGLFEFDDILHNTIGVTIGFGLLICMKKAQTKGKNNRNCCK